VAAPGRARLRRYRIGVVRELGRTGLVVSPIGLGLAALGRPAYINLGHDEDLGADRSVEALLARAHEVLETAYERRVRYFDAARSYGRAEEFLASWLDRRGVAPGDVTVGSKWGYEYTGAWRVDAERHEVKDLSVPTFHRQLAETRSLLGRHLDLYQIHSATIESGVLHDRELLNGLAELRSTGVAVGLTVTGPRQRATIEQALEVGLFDTVQATWNLLERSAEPALETAHAAGLGVIVKEAVANGRLTARGAPLELAAAAAELGASPDAVAIAAVLARPWADVVLSGAATVEQLESNLTAIELDCDTSLDRRLAPLAEDPKTYWRTRAAQLWN
jgi:aryl-alcohol dehydrogenase-like predicted oxidoreductase